MMTIEQALAVEGTRIVARDRYSGHSSLIRIFSVGRSESKLLARAEAPADQGDALIAKSQSHGASLGATYRACGVVWAIDGHRCQVWDASGEKLQLTDGEALLATGSIRLADVGTVVSFYDENDYGHRGVRFELRDGRVAVVVEEHDAAAEMDPTYGMTNLQIDGGWITYLGRELAARLGVPHRDELSGGRGDDPVEKAEYDAEIAKFERSKHVSPSKLVK